MADAPRIGPVIDHYFLWVDEQAAGQIEGRKSRPCLIVAVEHRDDAPPRVTVLPITSQPPRAPASTDAIWLATERTESPPVSISASTASNLTASA